MSSNALPKSLAKAVFRLAALVIAVGFAALAAEKLSARHAEPSASPDVVRYPLGRWRLDPSQRSKLVYNVRHIVLRHEGSSIVDGHALQRVYLPRSKRGREEAARLAGELYERLARTPAAFDSIAARFSDDPATAHAGGDLGHVDGTRLPESYLDVLGSLKPGDISRPFETTAGVHIVQRQRVAEPRRVAWSQILVSFEPDEDTFTKVVPRPERSRSEAIHVAADLSKQLARRPQDFTRLAKEVSDDPISSMAGGGVGWMWNIRSGKFHAEIGVVSKLSVGEISAVVETPEGLKILRRDAIGKPLVFRFAQYRHPVTQDADRAAERRHAESAHAQLVAAGRHDGAGWEDLDFSAGQLPIEYDDALRAVEVGQFVPTVLEFRDQLITLKRLEPLLADPPAPQIDNSLPSRPNVPWFIGAVPARELLPLVDQARDLGRKTLSLDDRQREGFDRAISRLRRGFEKLDSAGRIEMFHDVMLELEHVLGPEEMERFRGMVDRQVARVLLTPRQ